MEATTITFGLANWREDAVGVMEIIEVERDEHRGYYILRFPPNTNLIDCYSATIRRNSGGVYDANGNEVLFLWREKGRWTALHGLTETTREHLDPFYAIAKLLNTI